MSGRRRLRSGQERWKKEVENQEILEIEVESQEVWKEEVKIWEVIRLRYRQNRCRSNLKANPQNRLQYCVRNQEILDQVFAPESQ